MLMALACAAILLSLIMSGAWLYQRRVGNAGWVDVFWTFGLGLAGIGVALAPDAGADWPSLRQSLVAAMIAAWSLRLGAHLWARVRVSAEDARYNAFRTEWAPHFERRLFWFLQIQAAAAVFLASAVLLAAHDTRPLGLQDALGVAIAVAAVIGEGLADSQLRRFKSDPAKRKRVCDVGLWGWSRHPNYFFEWLGWVAYAVMAIDPSGDFAWGWAALAAPAFMYLLLVYASGVPPLEKNMLRSGRADAYRAYQARTSAFFPLPPRNAPLRAAPR